MLLIYIFFIYILCNIIKSLANKETIEAVFHNPLLVSGLVACKSIHSSQLNWGAKAIFGYFDKKSSSSSGAKAGAKKMEAEQ